MNKDSLISICFIASTTLLFIFLPLGLVLTFVGVSNCDVQLMFAGIIFLIAGVISGIAMARILTS